MNTIDRMRERITTLQRLLLPGQVLTAIKVTPQEYKEMVADAQEAGLLIATDRFLPDTFMGIPVVVVPDY